MIFRWQHRKWTTGVLVLCCLNATLALFPDDNDEEKRCTSEFEEYSEYSNSSFRICASILFSHPSSKNRTFAKMTWDYADAACNERFSFLIDTNSRFYNASNLQADLSSIGMEMVWVGIRKISGFYTWKTSNKKLFHTMEDWGNEWQNEEEPVDDCVAMNVSSGLLLTFPCETIELPVVCMNNGFPVKPFKSLLCNNGIYPDQFEDEVYMFSYQLDYGSENCIKVFPPQQFSVAEEHCSEEGGQLVSGDDLLNLYHTLKGNYLGNMSSDYWFSGLDSNFVQYINETKTFEDKTCIAKTFIQNEMKRSYFNCSKKLPFICKKPIYKNFTLKSIIHPFKMTSFASTDMSYKKLTCYGQIDDSYSSLWDPMFAYQWYKNRIPVSNIPTIHPASVYDDSKENGDLASRQGTFQCEVIIVGVKTATLSQEINIYFSDVSTFILTISGSSIPYNISNDFSHPRFELTFDLIRQPIDSLVELTQELFLSSSVFWDLQDISSNDIETTVSVLIFLNWTSEAGNQRPLREKQDVYDPLFQILEKNLYLFDEWGSTSLTLKSADVCFSKTIKMTKSNENVSLSWPEAFQSSSVTSNPTCQTQLNLETRTCIGSFVHGAQWSDFNESMCTFYKPSISDFVDPCPNGFEYVSGEICIHYHTDIQTWDEALNICATSLSYMADGTVLKNLFETDSFSKDKEDKKMEMWISHRPINGIFQPAGISNLLIPLSTTFRVNDNISIQNGQCLSMVFRNMRLQPVVFSNKNCTTSLPYACVVKPIQLSPVSLCPKNWIGSLYHDKCYYISDQELRWEDSITSCHKTHTGSKILELQNQKSYSFLRSFIQDNPLIRKSSKWWMGLQKAGKKIMWLSNHSNVEFVDWHEETKLWNNVSAGIITYESNVKESTSVKWNLDNIYSKNKYICEAPTLRIFRTAHAQVIVKNYTLINHENTIMKFPEMHCHVSGDFAPNSFMWFKDEFPVQNEYGDSLSLNWKSFVNFEDLIKLQGYYVCSVFQIKPFKRVFSEKFLYRIETQSSKLKTKMAGFKTFAISVNSKHMFGGVCLGFAFGNFKSSAPPFLTELSSLLNTSYINQLSLRNISCQSSGTNILIHLHLLESKRNEEKEDLKKVFDHLKNSVSPNINFWIEDYKINKNNITVRSTMFCYEEKTKCGHKNVTWTETKISQVTVPEELCVTESGKAVYRRCLGDYNIGAFWGPITGECSDIAPQLTVSLHQLSNKVISKDNIWNVSHSLLNLTSAYDDFNTLDIHYIAKTLGNIAGDSFIEQDIIHFATESVNNVLGAVPSILGDSQSRLNTSSQIIDSLKRMTLAADFQNSSYQLTLDNVAVNFRSLQAASNHSIPIGTAAMSVERNKNWNVITIFNGSTFPSSGIEAGILLPTNLVLGKHLENTINQNRHLNFIIYRNPAFFQSQNKVMVVSSIVQAFIGDEYLIDLEPQVRILFRLSDNVNSENVEQAACAFWDQRLNDMMGAWSREGCTSVSFFNGTMECQCDHMTSFAIILEQSTSNAISRPHRVSLSIITYTGCCLSIFGLGMTIITYAIFRKWRKGNKHKTLCNLSVALLCVLIIFVFGIDRKDSTYGCIVVAILLHYFMLASIAWMLVEAVIQYLNFVKVYGSYIPRFMLKAMCFAWGMPLLIISIILSIDYELYNGQQKYCWLSNKAFYYAFALPVLLMLVANLVIFIVILYSITCGRDKGLRSNQSEKKHVLTCIRAAFCIFVLLGLSWLFGFMAIDGAQLVFHYLFAISTTLQGFFIFLLFIVQEKTARELWQNLIFPNIIPSKSQNSNSTGDISMSQAKHVRKLCVTN